MFDEITYLMLHPDVSNAVDLGHFSSGKQHYLQFGYREGRALQYRNDSSKGRIVITGTGRAGTTLLVQILTSLHFDTGFSQEEALSSIEPISKAGLEHGLAPNAPLVVKSPWLAETLQDDLKNEALKIAFAILPLRNLKHAADSRRRVGQIAVERGDNPAAAAGGLWLTNDPDEQETVLVRQFYKVVYTFVQHGIQPIFIEFPRFALDLEYLTQILWPVWHTYGVSKKELANSIRKVVDLSKINFR